MPRMSTGGRIAVLAAVIVLAIAGFVLASGNSDDGGSDTTTTSAATSTGTSAETSTETTTTTTPAKPKKPRIPVHRIVVSGGQPVGGVKRIRVKKGDRVRLLIRSDVVDHVHVHGYDLMKDVKPGRAARFNFRANADGSYEIELEDRAVQIASLIVAP